MHRLQPTAVVVGLPRTKITSALRLSPTLCRCCCCCCCCVVDRNVESYSQLSEAAKQIIARVAGRLSGVRLSGLMDPAVTGLERAAVVANTPITFRPRELLGVSPGFERHHRTSRNDTHHPRWEVARGICLVTSFSAGNREGGAPPHMGRSGNYKNTCHCS